MPSAPLEITVRPSWRLAFRTALHDALFTRHLLYWLLRAEFAALLVVAGQSTFGRACRGVDGLDLGLFGTVLLIAPLVWLVYPLAKIRAAGPSTVTILDEGLSIDAGTHALSVAREGIRGVRRMPWDLVIVLDGATIALPLRTLAAGAADAVVARLRTGVAEPRRTTERAGGMAQAPYRSAESRPLGPEDEQAEPQDWVAPPEYRESVLAFPTTGEHVRAFVSTRRGAFFTPAVLLVLGGCLVLLGTAGGGDPRGEIVPFMTLGAVLALFGVGVFVLEVLPGLHALRDRSVRERRAGVLYAVGRSGLYVRTRSFELREPWKRIKVVTIGKRRVAIATADVVLVIPVAAFANAGSRTTFLSTLEHETDKRAAAAS